jgi:hypothetical protein
MGFGNGERLSARFPIPIPIPYPEVVGARGGGVKRGFYSVPGSGLRFSVVPGTFRLLEVWSTQAPFTYCEVGRSGALIILMQPAGAICPREYRLFR